MSSTRLVIETSETCKTLLDKLEAIQFQVIQLLEEVLKMRRTCADNLIDVLEVYDYDIINAISEKLDGNESDLV